MQADSTLPVEQRRNYKVSSPTVMFLHSAVCQDFSLVAVTSCDQKGPGRARPMHKPLAKVFAAIGRTEHCCSVAHVVTLTSL
jgi:hypothetical protein